MKKIIFALILVIGASNPGIYGQTKNDDILKLIKVSGQDKLLEQVYTVLIDQFKILFPEVPNRFWVKFREKLKADDVLYMCIPAYSKYYTHEEIKQLILFYESPLGRRVVEVTPLLTLETMDIGKNWGERIGVEIVNELIKEGY